MSATLISSTSPTTYTAFQNSHRNSNGIEPRNRVVLENQPGGNTQNVGGNTRLNQRVIHQGIRSRSRNPVEHSEEELSLKVFQALGENNPVLFKRALEKAKRAGMDLTEKRDPSGGGVFDKLTMGDFNKNKEKMLKYFFGYLSDINSKNSDGTPKTINTVKDSSGKTLFDITINRDFNAYRNKDVLLLVLKLGFDVNAKSVDGVPAFFQFLQKPNWLEYAVGRISSINISKYRKHTGDGMPTGLVKGMDFNSTDSKGNTILHKIVESEDVNTLVFFLTRSHPNIRDVGYTQVAPAYKELQTGKLAAFYKINSDGKTPADIAATKSESFQSVFRWMGNFFKESYGSNIITGNQGADHLLKIRVSPDRYSWNIKKHPDASIAKSATAL